jgi:hypothetical protein
MQNCSNLPRAVAATMKMNSNRLETRPRPFGADDDNDDDDDDDAVAEATRRDAT